LSANYQITDLSERSHANTERPGLRPTQAAASDEQTCLLRSFLNLGRERLGLAIGDISGKGIAAALMMANLQANLRSQCAIALDQPQVVLRSVNQLFYENTTDSAYATLFFAEYDDKAQRLRYANCGHLSALLLRSDNTLERLDSTCTVLGLFKEWQCSIAESRLFFGDTLVLYTDGITESFDDAGEEFGETATHRSVAATPCTVFTGIACVDG
jgi:serine phosphatase RsbU (regulator of sigma subunit)